MTRIITAALLGLAVTGCATMPAVDPAYRVRPETRQECATHCQTLGMRLSAVVLVRNAAGCVCGEPEAPAAQGAGGGAAANAGAYLVALAEEEERQQREATTRNAGAGAPGTPGSRR